MEILFHTELMTGKEKQNITAKHLTQCQVFNLHKINSGCIAGN